MAVASQFVLHGDDSVEVRYLDGSRLQLTPCGSVFVHQQPPGQEQHPLHGVRRVQQRTRFATSEFRDKVTGALEFRNKFAECPFICRDLLKSEDLVILHTDVNGVKWPNNVKNKNVTLTPSGGVSVNSNDGHACLTLSPCGHQCTVKYLARVSHSVSKAKASPGRSHAANKAEADSNIREEDKQERSYSRNCSKRQYESSLDGSYRETLLDDGVERHLLGVDRTSTPNHMEGPLTWNLSSVNTQNTSEQSKINTHLEANNDNVRWEYVWLVKFMSVYECHEAWKHPLQIALQFYDLCEAQLNTDTSGFKTSSISTLIKENSPSSSEDSAEDWLLTSLPRSLPQTCPASHLHRFKDEVELHLPDDGAQRQQQKVKVLFTHGIIYWMLWRASPRAVHIFPGDGSVLRSHGPAGNFFKHTFIKDGKRDERVHSVKCPPPKLPGAVYSVANLITTGSGLLYTMLQEPIRLQKSTSNKPTCWQVEVESNVRPMATILLEESVVAGIGRFSAYSNGHVRVVFEDRTCLDMIYDFSKRIEHCLQHSPDDTLQRSISYRGEGGGLKQAVIEGVTSDLCRLLLPSAEYVAVSLSSPQQYARYIQAAVEWAGWVNSSPSERYLYYKDTIYDPEKQQSVNTELKKISCFNYIVENTVLGKSGCSDLTLQDATRSSNVHTDVTQDASAMSLEEVQRALTRTANAISDIDQLLKPK